VPLVLEDQTVLQAQLVYLVPQATPDPKAQLDHMGTQEVLAQLALKVILALQDLRAQLDLLVLV